MLLFWGVGAFVYCRGVQRLRLSLDKVKRDYEQLGPMSGAEKLACALVLIQIVLWVARGNGPNASAGGFGGWSAWFTPGVAIGDGTVSMFIALLLFVLPTHVASWEEQQEINAIELQQQQQRTGEGGSIDPNLSTTMMQIDDDDSLYSVESVAEHDDDGENAEEAQAEAGSTPRMTIGTVRSRRTMRERARRLARKPIRATSFLIERDIHDIPWPVMLLLGAGWCFCI